MKVSKKILLIPSLLLLLLSGCSNTQKKAVVIHPAEFPAERTRDANIADRFKESAPQAPSAVDSAIELSQKYAELSQQAAMLRQENQNLITENKELKNRITTLDAQLQQTQKELTEANNLLLEMRIELNNWKADILGFRDEMREADKAQLEALLKILKILGGEIGAEPAQADDTGAISASPRETGQIQQGKTVISGEPNE